MPEVEKLKGITKEEAINNFLIENPDTSEAWKVEMMKAESTEQLNAVIADIPKNGTSLAASKSERNGKTIKLSPELETAETESFEQRKALFLQRIKAHFGPPEKSSLSQKFINLVDAKEDIDGLLNLHEVFKNIIDILNGKMEISDVLESSKDRVLTESLITLTKNTKAIESIEN